MDSKRDLKLVSLRAGLRHERIRSQLASLGRVSISDLAEQLAVTAVTIREDLKFLEEGGHLTRIRGGAVGRAGVSSEIALEITSQTLSREKAAIGSFAASMIRSGQTVMLDVGSTTTALAKALPTDLRDVIVITNGLNIALSLESVPGISVIVTGGTLRPLQHSLVAPMGTLLLERLRADVAFLGCNGVDPARGFTNANIAEAEIKQAMVKSSDYIVYLADHTKIGSVGSALLTDIESADLLITDSLANAETLKKLRGQGLKIECVEPKLLGPRTL